jgi:hypothetical protein
LTGQCLIPSSGSRFASSPFGQYEAITRNEVDKTFERGLNGGEVFENVRVIELNIVDDRNLGR